MPEGSFNAAVMAGERPGRQEVAEIAGACCKALAEVAGRSMLTRVLDSLEQSRMVTNISVVGLPLQAQFEWQRQTGRERPDYRLLEGRSTPSASVCHVLRQQAQDLPLLITTADHALLTAEMVDHFCAGALDSRAELVVGLVQIDDRNPAFSSPQPTRLRFQGRDYAGSNLYAFLQPDAVRVPEFWAQMEQHRKKPWKLIAELGLFNLLRYRFDRLSLEDALHALSYRLRVDIEAVIMPWPEAAIDVDTEQDWVFANEYLARGAGLSASREGPE